MGYYNYNIKKLRKQRPDIIELLDAEELNEELKSDEKDSANVEWKKTPGGKEYLECSRNENTWNLNSIYNEKKYIKQWMKQYEDLEYMSVVHFFGMAPTAYIEELLETTSENIKVLIYEPSIEVFLTLMRNKKLDFLKNNRLALVVKGINDPLMTNYLIAMIGYHSLTTQKFICAPNYENAFSETYKEYTQSLKKYFENRVMDRNTDIRFSKEVTYNNIRNIKHILGASIIDQLYSRIPDDIPAIVVSAGPSLNKNILELKKAKGKAFIIATDTALKPLVANDIMPDIFVTVDPSKPMVLFEHEKIMNLPVLLMDNANHQITEEHKGKKFFSDSQNFYVSEMFDKFDIDYIPMPTGGSVANNAFSLAHSCGIKKIILVGQDLAYPGNKTHADGTFKEKMDVIDMTDDRYLEVEDIYGGQIITSLDFKHYLEWFEMKIKEYSDVEVIDATEGGAKIHGTTIMTLSEAIDKYCTKEVDLKEIIESVPKAFDEKQIKILKDDVKKIPVNLKKARVKMKQGIELYEKFVKAFENPGTSGEEIAKLNKKIKKITNQVEKDPVVYFLMPYIRLLDYQMMTNLAEKREKVEDDVAEIADRGIKMFKALLETADLLEPEIEKTVKEIMEDNSKENTKK